MPTLIYLLSLSSTRYKSKVLTFVFALLGLINAFRLSVLPICQFRFLDAVSQNHRKIKVHGRSLKMNGITCTLN